MRASAVYNFGEPMTLDLLRCILKSSIDRSALLKCRGHRELCRVPETASKVPKDKINIDGAMDASANADHVQGDPLRKISSAKPMLPLAAGDPSLDHIAFGW